ncbi:hypothetical protein Y032_0092g2596 [Ancylostoma ceylanicum]|uniref:Uncharacterized protein n=1 Tax=Ancylostoma ceylanicum TaxID=53326 RepID=A0A016TM45_9BILA|nr:hypothetical protein Y032_0092g2596 [Ancylostoma ceylanicum]
MPRILHNNAFPRVHILEQIVLLVEVPHHSLLEKLEGVFHVLAAGLYMMWENCSPPWLRPQAPQKLSIEKGVFGRNTYTIVIRSS